jgi:PmbA protein
VKEQILHVLRELRAHALRRGYEVDLFYQDEESSLIRFANSAVSLNTNERLVRLRVTAYAGQKRASYQLITDLGRLDEMVQAMDAAAEMVHHSQPLSYQPTIPVYTESFIDERGYNMALAQLSGQARLDYFNHAVQGIETPELRLSGIFSSGTNTLAVMNTRSEHALYFRTSDAQATVVLAHSALKWEIQAEQSAQQAPELDPEPLRQELALLADLYTRSPAIQLPLGRYDIIFGPAATADLLTVMTWIGYSGGALKRGYSFLSEAQVGQKVFSNQITLVDDPEQLATFPFKMDLTGIPRRAHPIIQGGTFTGFLWPQDDADEFGAQPTGHTVPHPSLVLQGGIQATNSLPELLTLPRARDTLYIPFLHYMNIVNPTQALVTGSSRFGALLLGADGSVKVPYNVRLTQSLLDIFGERVEWLSQATLPYNTSQSYGARNPTALVVPRFIQVRDLEISHSNPSY